MCSLINKVKWEKMTLSSLILIKFFHLVFTLILKDSEQCCPGLDET